MIFAQNLRLNQGETASDVIVNLVDGNNQSFDVPATDVRAVPNVDLTQVALYTTRRSGAGHLQGNHQGTRPNEQYGNDSNYSLEWCKPLPAISSAPGDVPQSDAERGKSTAIQNAMVQGQRTTLIPGHCIPTKTKACRPSVPYRQYFRELPVSPCCRG